MVTEKVVYEPERPYVVQVGEKLVRTHSPLHSTPHDEGYLDWGDEKYFDNELIAKAEADELAESNRYVRVIHRGGQ